MEENLKSNLIGQRDIRLEKLNQLKYRVDRANLSTVCDKRELEIPLRGSPINVLQAAATIVGDWWKERVKSTD